jgi:hypothetical protein
MGIARNTAQLVGGMFQSSLFRNTTLNRAPCAPADSMEHSGSAGVPPGVDASDMSAEAMQAFSEQMSGNINSIIDRQMKKMPYTHPDTFLESLEAFSAAVDWSERWIMAIGVLHVCMWVSAFATRKHYMQQFAGVCVVCSSGR